MKRTHLSLFIALSAIALVVVPVEADTLSKKQEKKVRNYFSTTLQGAAAEYNGCGKMSISEIDDVRSRVWECWREAVNALDEEKFIAPHATSEPRDTGFWTLPATLEENAVMPYYFIKKGDKPSEGYPLFLYMHGSGNKEREWETGYKLCSSFEDSPSVHFVPQIPNGYGELYRWAIQSKQWAWESCCALLL